MSGINGIGGAPTASVFSSLQSAVASVGDFFGRAVNWIKDAAVNVFQTVSDALSGLMSNFENNRNDRSAGRDVMDFLRSRGRGFQDLGSPPSLWTQIKRTGSDFLRYCERFFSDVADT